MNMITLRKSAKEAAIATAGLVLFAGAVACAVIGGIYLLRAGYGWVAAGECLVVVWAVLTCSRWLHDRL